jgi:hypothetical protein
MAVVAGMVVVAAGTAVAGMVLVWRAQSSGWVLPRWWVE